MGVYVLVVRQDDEDVYYPKRRRPREDEEVRGKLRKAKAEAWKRGLVARSCASTGREDVVREVKGIEKMLGP